MNITELQRMSIKLFTNETTTVELQEFIPIFHQWIQENRIREHLLIDVADYSHVHNGPGILLITQEGNFSMDQSNGRLGLLYQRKQKLKGNLQSRILNCIQIASFVSHLLEDDENIKSKLQFNRNEFQFIANDRLLVPNTIDYSNSILTQLKAVSTPLFETENIKMTPNSNTKECLAVSVSSEKELSMNQIITG